MAKIIGYPRDILTASILHKISWILHGLWEAKIYSSFNQLDSQRDDFSGASEEKINIEFSQDLELSSMKSSFLTISFDDLNQYPFFKQNDKEKILLNKEKYHFDLKISFDSTFPRLYQWTRNYRLRKLNSSAPKPKGELFWFSSRVWELFSHTLSLSSTRSRAFVILTLRNDKNIFSCAKEGRLSNRCARAHCFSSISRL